ncbi:MAG: hypothetical protein SGILL_005989 [Bacillariaceae sp.]
MPVEVVGSPNNSPEAEGPDKAFDLNLNTKFLVFSSDSRLEAEFGEPEEVIFYNVASASDSAERDPLEWSFEGSNDGNTWETLDTQTDIDFAFRMQTLSFQIANPAAYRYYALEAKNNFGDITQYAELTLFVEDP